MRFLLHHDYREAKSRIIVKQVEIAQENPHAVTLTMFDYLRGRLQVDTFPITAMREKVPETWPWKLWPDHVARACESEGRIGLHAMVVGQGRKIRCWVLPLRTNDSFVRDSLVPLGDLMQDGTVGLIEALQALGIPQGIVEIH